jgi:hypothetical protein
LARVRAPAKPLPAAKIDYMTTNPRLLFIRTSA